MQDYQALGVNKPSIIKSNSSRTWGELWTCASRANCGYGKTLTLAYERWMSDCKKYPPGSHMHEIRKELWLAK